GRMTITRAARSNQPGSHRLLRAIGEVVERRHAVRLRPETDLAGVREGLIVPLERRLAVEGDGEVAAPKLDPQRVPQVRRHVRGGALLLGPPAVNRVVD